MLGFKLTVLVNGATGALYNCSQTTRLWGVFNYRVIHWIWDCLTWSHLECWIQPAQNRAAKRWNAKLLGIIRMFYTQTNIQEFSAKLIFIFIVLPGLYLRLTRVHLNQKWWPDPGFDNLKNVLDENFGTRYGDVIMRAMASQITGVSLFNRLFRRISKKTPKRRVTGLCEGNPPVVSPHKGPVTRKYFYLMTSSYFHNIPMVYCTLWSLSISRRW